MLRHSIVSGESGILPLEKLSIPQLENYIGLLDQFDVDSRSADGIVPPVLKSYIKAGAKIAYEPVYDSNFGSADFLTILDSGLINEK